MATTEETIKGRLEKAFSQKGFARPGVAELKRDAGVSLRTLYRYFPSKLDMVVGVLDFRHERYMRFLEQDLPEPGHAAVLHILLRLDDWMRRFAPNGCLSVNALAAYPDDRTVRSSVARHKQETIALMERCGGIPEIAVELFLVHEGVSAAWPVVGSRAVDAAKITITKLFNMTERSEA